MKLMEEKIQAIFDCFLPSSMDFYSRFELGLQLLAWSKLSQEKRIPEALYLPNMLSGVNAKALNSTFKQLSDIKDLKDQARAFSVCKVIDDIGLANAVHIAQEAARFGWLSPLDFSAIPYLNLSKELGFFYCPDEVLQLMTALAGKLKQKKVYCPYDWFCQWASVTTSQQADVAIEIPEHSVLPYTVQILTDIRFRTSFSHPIWAPSFVTAKALEKFDVTLAFPPVGEKFDRRVVDNDWFNRKFPNTTSGSILQLCHLIAQTDGRVIVAVPQGILSSRAEQKLRTELLHNRMIEGVIEMPPALLPLMAILFSILVLNTKGSVDQVRFVDGAQEQFFERNRRGQSRLSNWEALLDAYHHSTDESVAQTVDVEKVLEQEANLAVSNYLFTPAQKQVQSLLKSAPHQTLDSLVTIIRPAKKPKVGGDEEAFEVSVLEFPEFGYLQQPQNAIPLPPQGVSDRDLATFLQPLDIVIVIKGNTGLTAIAPGNVPSPGPGGWVVNQSCLILRADPTVIQAKALFMYLRSGVGQTFLRGLVAGATMPLIQLRALKKLSVIVPSPLEQAKVAQTFDEIVQTQNQIEVLKETQRQKEATHWALDS